MKGRALLPLVAGLVLGACQAQGPTAAPKGDTVTVPHRVLHASATCGTEEPSVRRIGDALRLKQILDSGAMLGASAQQPEADFSRQLVLRISMGQQPTAGAQFGVVGARSEGAGQRLVIDMTWAPPDPQRMQAMVITRPCVILGVPAGVYRSVQVLDAQGRERVSTTLPG
jgi:hypothetical protein